MSEQIKILGNKIDCFESYNHLYHQILSEIRNRKAVGYVTVNNVHTMMEGCRDSSYQRIINDAHFSIPDGKPLEIVGKLKGSKIVTRLFGPTVLESFIDWGRADSTTHFFFGSSEPTLNKLKIAIETKYPGTKITGMISPPFKSVEEWSNDTYIHLINQLRPDFIWVGLGAPKQERWMYSNISKLNYGMMFGIGAGFSYLAGDTKHAPDWMKNASLEWLYRLVQEPRRLWKRYFTTIPPFIILATRELIIEKFRSTKHT
jgi:bacterial polymer biosynthesis proteins, WecB/TagA/CpsF family